MHDVQYLTLHEAAKLVPGGTSANCIWRWCRKGVLSRGDERICLQHVRVGGKLYTTAAWMTEFWKLLAEADSVYFRLSAEPDPATHMAREEIRRRPLVCARRPQPAEVGA